MAVTYEQIGSTVIVGAGGAANITFSSIPATYTDLLIKTSSRTTALGTANNFAYSFNGSTANRGGVYLGGNGTSSSGGNVTEFLIWTVPFSDATASIFGSADIYISNYTSASNKCISTDGASENNATDGRVAFTASMWTDTAAITSVTLTPQSGTLVQYSTATLYGIKNS